MYIEPSLFSAFNSPLLAGVPSDDDLRRGENEAGRHLGGRGGGRIGGGRGSQRAASRATPRKRSAVASVATPETSDDEAGNLLEERSDV